MGKKFEKIQREMRGVDRAMFHFSALTCRDEQEGDVSWYTEVPVRPDDVAIYEFESVCKCIEKARDLAICHIVRRVNMELGYKYKSSDIDDYLRSVYNDGAFEWTKKLNIYNEYAAIYLAREACDLCDFSSKYAFDAADIIIGLRAVDQIAYTDLDDIGQNSASEFWPITIGEHLLVEPSAAMILVDMHLKPKNIRIANVSSVLAKAGITQHGKTLYKFKLEILYNIGPDKNSGNIGRAPSTLNIYRGNRFSILDNPKEFVQDLGKPMLSTMYITGELQNALEENSITYETDKKVQDKFYRMKHFLDAEFSVSSFIWLERLMRSHNTINLIIDANVSTIREKILCEYFSLLQTLYKTDGIISFVKSDAFTNAVNDLSDIIPEWADESIRCSPYRS